MSDQAKGPSATKKDQNPKGGLSAAGRKKYGVKKGVTNYGSASRADKGRWVSWAMRFTGTPKPVKDAKGQPTRYALMFRAWGEKVPTSAADVQAVHAKAVTRSKQLKNGDKKDKASLEETVEFVETHIVGCDTCERVFSDDASLWTHIEVVHLNDPSIPTATEEASVARTITTTATHDRAYASHLLREATKGMQTELAGLGLELTSLTCHAPGCGRILRGVTSFQEHAEAVHTFDDIRRLVRDAVGDKYNKEGDYKATPSIPGIWTYVEDLATDWVVFFRESGNDSSLYKASYSIVDGVVQLGEPTEVVRRTVYDPVASAT